MRIRLGMLIVSVLAHCPTGYAAYNATVKPSNATLNTSGAGTFNLLVPMITYKGVSSGTNNTLGMVFRPGGMAFETIETNSDIKMGKGYLATAANTIHIPDGTFSARIVCSQVGSQVKFRFEVDPANTAAHPQYYTIKYDSERGSPCDAETGLTAMNNYAETTYGAWFSTVTVNACARINLACYNYASGCNVGQTQTTAVTATASCNMSGCTCT